MSHEGAEGQQGSEKSPELIMWEEKLKEVLSKRRERELAYNMRISDITHLAEATSGARDTEGIREGLKLRLAKFDQSVESLRKELVEVARYHHLVLDWVERNPKPEK